MKTGSHLVLPELLLWKHVANPHKSKVSVTDLLLFGHSLQSLGHVFEPHHRVQHRLTNPFSFIDFVVLVWVLHHGQVTSSTENDHRDLTASSVAICS